MIVLDEREWAEDAIANKRMGKKPSDTLRRLAKYYRYVEGRKRSDICDMLEDFVKACDPSANPLDWQEAIKAAAKAGERHPLIQVDGIDVTESEMNTITKLDGTQRQRIAFTLLCVAKYYNAAREKNNCWVNEELKEIMNMAGVHVSSNRQSAYIHEFYCNDLIALSNRVDNINIRVKFIDDKSPVVMRITDFRNLGNQYLMYHGEPIFQCEMCGLAIRRRGNRHRFCPDCAAEIHIRQSMESLMRNSFQYKQTS